MKLITFRRDDKDKVKFEVSSKKINRDYLLPIIIPEPEFPNGLNAKRIVLEKSGEGESLPKPRKMLISAISGADDWVILGGDNGDLSLLKKNMFYKPEEMAVDHMKISNYCQGKNYMGHSGPIDSIQICGDKLYTSAFNEENLFEWTIDKGKKDWELDHLDYQMEIEEIFLREIERREEYEKIVNDSLPLRNQIVELKKNVDTSVIPEINLELKKVIGRKAFNSRNNMFYTADNNIAFIAASLIVLMKIPPEGLELTEENKSQFFTETFLDPDSEEDYSISPQISTFTLSKDRKHICVGTMQTKAKLITWELTSRTYMNTLILDDCCVILNLSYSFDRSRILCVALTKHYT